MQLEAKPCTARRTEDLARFSNGVCARFTEHVRETSELLSGDTRNHFVHEQGDVVRTAISSCACLEGSMVVREKVSGNLASGGASKTSRRSTDAMFRSRILSILVLWVGVESGSRTGHSPCRPDLCSANGLSSLVKY